ncbi:MAG: hypothetical protein K5886_08935 [Lachnospiraceae bacterium]|nr:hypothetical protein [Lachnospiraceae bacterium]
MRIICFRELKNLPKQVTVMWILALLFALAGITLLLLDMFGVTENTLKYALACVVIGQLINIFCLRKYKDRLYR